MPSPFLGLMPLYEERVDSHILGWPMKGDGILILLSLTNCPDLLKSEW